MAAQIKNGMWGGYVQCSMRILVYVIVYKMLRVCAHARR